MDPWAPITDQNTVRQTGQHTGEIYPPPVSWNYNAASDVYFYKPKAGDELMISYFAENAGIPGPLERMKRPNSTGPRKTYNTMRDLFNNTEYLAYSNPSERAMKAPRPLVGHDVNQWDVFDMPDDYFTSPQSRREKCTCQQKKNLHHR